MKTLKDITKEFENDYNENHQEGTFNISNALWKQKLKEAAIECRNSLLYEASEIGRKTDRTIVIFGIIEWIDAFFNLTEEDLK
jgi:hypothetical protein